MHADGGLDAIDWALLERLQTEGRAGWSELGRLVNLSAPAVAERVRRLQEAGVIAGYRAVVDPARLGLPLRAMIRLEPSRKKDWTTLSALIQDLPEVIRANRVTGTDCYVLEVAVADVAHLERLLDQLLTHGDTTTSLILSTPVPHQVHRRNGQRAGQTAAEARPDPSVSGGIVINADSALAPS